MKLNIRERGQKVFETLSSQGHLTIRAMAKAIGISKSSVHRHQQARVRRNQHPESGLWESPMGAEWLKLLVLATIFVFCFKRGVGCESLSEFFQLLHLERHVGISVASLRQLRAQMEEQIPRISTVCNRLHWLRFKARLRSVPAWTKPFSTKWC